MHICCNLMQRPMALPNAWGCCHHGIHAAHSHHAITHAVSHVVAHVVAHVRGHVARHVPGHVAAHVATGHVATGHVATGHVATHVPSHIVHHGVPHHVTPHAHASHVPSHVPSHASTHVSTHVSTHAAHVAHVGHTSGHSTVSHASTHSSSTHSTSTHSTHASSTHGHPTHAHSTHAHATHPSHATTHGPHPTTVSHSHSFAVSFAAHHGWVLRASGGANSKEKWLPQCLHQCLCVHLMWLNSMANRHWGTASGLGELFSDWKESSQRFHAQAPMGTPQAPSPNPPSMVTWVWRGGIWRLQSGSADSTKLLGGFWQRQQGKAFMSPSLCQSAAQQKLCYQASIWLQTFWASPSWL